MNFEEVTNKSFEDTLTAYNFKDSILYALGVGFGAEPLDSGHLKFLYEDGLKAVPTMANVLAHPGMWVRDAQYDVDWKKLLHAEQRLTIHKPLAPEGKIRGKHNIMGLRDRGAEAGAFLYQQKTVHDADSDEVVASVVTTLMLRGDGGCGDWGNAPEGLSKLPEHDPDISVDIQTTELAPLIYRLSGDLNPLHIDPAIAEAVGFPRPILHGLATKGFACYAILKTFCDFDPTKLKSIAVRFSRPVLPGDRLRFEFWKESDGVIRFRAAVPDRDLVVLDRCSAEIA